MFYFSIQVIGANEREAIIHGWLTFGAVTRLIFLNAVTLNPFLGIFFRWSHEAVVFTQVTIAVTVCVN